MNQISILLQYSFHSGERNTIIAQYLIEMLDIIVLYNTAPIIYCLVHMTPFKFSSYDVNVVDLKQF